MADPASPASPESLASPASNEDWRVEMIPANGLVFETAVMGEAEPLALCLHGFPETYFSWRYQMPLLKALGYTVWAPNMRGYGYSSRPENVSDYAMPNLLDDVSGLYDAAVEKGHKPSLLLVHDWGGLVGWTHILEGLRPFDRFIAVNIPHPDRIRAGFFRHGQFLKSWYVFFFQLPRLPEWALTRNGAEFVARAFKDTAANKERFSEDVLEVYRVNALLPGAATAMINYYRANMGGSGGGQGNKGPRTTDVPTLMIWGENDMALGVHLTEGTDTLVSNLTLKRLPGISHWAQQDAPDEVNAIIREWLTG